MDSSLKSGDVISCILTSSYSCPGIASANSNSVVMNVVPLISPSVTIATTKISICPGTMAAFLATPLNGGTFVGYQWTKNGISVGTNGNVYTDSKIVNGDIINCTIKSNAKCLATASATSNNISMTVFKNPVVALDKTNTLCDGSSRLFDAGSFFSYLWNDGSTGKSLSVNKPGVYYVSVVDNNGCKGSDTTIIKSLLSIPIGFLQGDTSICSYGSLLLKAKPGYKNYLWSNGASSAIISINNPGLYWLQVIDNNDCKGRDSVNVTLKECMQGFYAPTAFSPNNDGKNDIFRPLLFGNIKSYSIVVYNRFGQIVFQTTDVKKGWDGYVKHTEQNSDVFVWICSYQFEGQPPVTKRGSVILLR